MGKPAAKEGDEVVGTDTHVVLVTTPGGPQPTPQSSPFRGPVTRELSATVYVDGRAAVVQGSVADNASPHVPVGGTFQREPSNEATVCEGSESVFMDDAPSARDGDRATTCNDPVDAPNGALSASSTVMVG